MFTALGVGSNMAWQAGLFHLVTHAFFKACLFLGSGSVIHACHHEQDMSRMGGLWKKLPITGMTYLVACLSIAGTPFLTAGFYSKDQILASLWAGGETASPVYYVIFWVLATTAAMTAFYMFRSFWLTFFTKPRDAHIYEHAHESPATITIPLVVLAALAICAGGFFGAMTWHDAFLPNEGHEAIVRFAPTQPEFTHGNEVWDHAHHFALLVSLTVCTLGIGLSFIAYMTPVGDRARKAARDAIAPLYRAAKAKYWMDEFNEALIVRTTVLLAAISAALDSKGLDAFVDATGSVTTKAGRASGVADVVIVDGAVDGTGLAAWGGGGVLSRFQSGRIRNYLFGAVAVTALFAVVVLYMSRR
jgi:NADH-quinone oxidoreductase subunit L